MNTNMNIHIDIKTNMDTEPMTYHVLSSRILICILEVWTPKWHTVKFRWRHFTLNECCFWLLAFFFFWNGEIMRRFTLIFKRDKREVISHSCFYYNFFIAHNSQHFFTAHNNFFQLILNQIDPLFIQN